MLALAAETMSTPEKNNWRAKPWGHPCLPRTILRCTENQPRRRRRTLQTFRRVFDLTNSNDAVIVLTARAREPQPVVSGEDTVPPKDFFVSEVAREDLNGDLHKVSSNVTDTRHLDVSPRWEMIDCGRCEWRWCRRVIVPEIFGRGQRLRHLSRHRRPAVSDFRGDARRIGGGFRESRPQARLHSLAFWKMPLFRRPRSSCPGKSLSGSGRVRLRRRLWVDFLHRDDKRYSTFSRFQMGKQSSRNSNRGRV